MATLFFIFILLAGYHFYMENVVIPYWRTQSRLKLLRLKSRLHAVSKQHPNLPVHMTDMLEKMILHAASTLAHYNLFDFVFFVAQNKKPQGSEEVEKFITSIETCGVGEVKQIYLQYSRSVKKILFANSSGWLIYMLPFVLLALLIKAIASFCKTLYGIANPRFEIVHFSHRKLYKYQVFEQQQHPTHKASTKNRSEAMFAN